MGQKPAGTQCEVKCKHTPERIQFQCGFDGLWVPLSNPTCSVSLVLDPIIVDEPYRLALPTGGTVKKETVQVTSSLCKVNVNKNLNCEQARVDDGQSRRSLDSNGTVVHVDTKSSHHILMIFAGHSIFMFQCVIFHSTRDNTRQ